MSLDPFDRYRLAFRTFISVFITLQLVPHFARADILSFRQNLVGPTPGEVVEITTHLSESKEDTQRIISEIRQDLDRDRITNPELKPHFEAVGEPALKVANQIAPDSNAKLRVLPETLESEMEKKFPRWLDRHYRLVFSITRGTINGSVATYSLAVAHGIPFPVAAAGGALTGAISFGLQFYNKKLQDFLVASIISKNEPKNIVLKGMKRVEPFARWYALEVGFVAVTQLIMTALGHPPEGTLEENITANLSAALATVGAQGFWDVAVSKETKRQLARAKTLVAKRRIQFRSDLATLVISALAVGGMIGKLADVPAADGIFYAMGATGVVYFLKVIHTEWKCKKLMREPLPDLEGSGKALPLNPTSSESSAFRFDLRTWDSQLSEFDLFSRFA